MAIIVNQDSDVELTALAQFMRVVRATKPLSDDKMTRLLVDADDGNITARNQLIEALQPFVLSVAKRFTSRCETLDLLDLAQEGSIGLLHAIEAQQKRAADMPFMQFAFYWVRNAVVQAIYRDERFIRLPAKTLRRLRQLVASQSQVLEVYGRDATVDELVTSLGLPRQEVINLLLLQAERCVSLDAPSEYSCDLTLADTLPALPDGADSNSSLLHQWLRALVEALPERERRVITLRYGFDGEEGRTTNEVAALLGLSPRLVQDLDRRVRLHIRVAMHLRTPALVA